MSTTFAILWLALAAEGAPAAPTAEQIRCFESSVRPVLVEQCQKCHGRAKQRNGLWLDSREARLRGGDFGPAIEPGKPDESRLIRAVRQTDAELQMPPESKLTDRQIADLARWVDMGARFRAAESTS